MMNKLLRLFYKHYYMDAFLVHIVRNRNAKKLLRIESRIVNVKEFLFTKVIYCNSGLKQNKEIELRKESTPLEISNSSETFRTIAEKYDWKYYDDRLWESQGENLLKNALVVHLYGMLGGKYYREDNAYELYGGLFGGSYVRMHTIGRYYVGKYWRGFVKEHYSVRTLYRVRKAGYYPRNSCDKFFMPRYMGYRFIYPWFKKTVYRKAYKSRIKNFWYLHNLIRTVRLRTLVRRDRKDTSKLGKRITILFSMYRKSIKWQLRFLRTEYLKGFRYRRKKLKARGKLRDKVRALLYYYTLLPMYYYKYVIKNIERPFGAIIRNYKCLLNKLAYNRSAGIFYTKKYYTIIEKIEELKSLLERIREKNISFPKEDIIFTFAKDRTINEWHFDDEGGRQLRIGVDLPIGNYTRKRFPVVTIASKFANRNKLVSGTETCIKNKKIFRYKVMPGRSIIYYGKTTRNYLMKPVMWRIIEKDWLRIKEKEAFKRKDPEIYRLYRQSIAINYQTRVREIISAKRGRRKKQWIMFT